MSRTWVLGWGKEPKMLCTVQAAWFVIISLPHAIHYWPSRTRDLLWLLGSREPHVVPVSWAVYCAIVQMTSSKFGSSAGEQVPLLSRLQQVEANCTGSILPSNNSPSSLRERNESLPLAQVAASWTAHFKQPISVSPTVGLSKSRHPSPWTLEGHTGVHGEWSCFTFRGIVALQETSLISLRTWLPLTCQMKTDVKLLKSSAKGNESELRERCFAAFSKHISQPVLWAKTECGYQVKTVIISISNCIRYRW